jgi:hypothetical protein
MYVPIWSNFNIFVGSVNGRATESPQLPVIGSYGGGSAAGFTEERNRKSGHEKPKHQNDTKGGYRRKTNYMAVTDIYY